jgi:hypothetical protein
MELLILIVIVQMGLIGWLLYPRIKPKAVDHWAKAEEMIARWKRTDEENWEIDFKVAQGLPIEPPEPPKPIRPHHAIVNKWTDLYYGSERLHFKCACGFTDNTYVSELLEEKFKEHVNKRRQVEGQ